MSNNNNNNSNNNKNKKAKIDSSVSKKKFIEPELYCSNCGLDLDNDEHLPFIYSDEFGECDVCEECFNTLTRENAIKSSLISKQPSIPKNPIPINPVLSTKPTIKLVFFNNASNIHSIPSDKDKEKREDKDKDKDKDKEKGKGKNGKAPVLLRTTKIAGCDSKCNKDEDNSSLLFFQQVLERLQNIDNAQHRNSNRETETELETELETDTEMESKSLEYEWLGDNIKNIKDLIELGKSYNTRKRKRYNLNLKQLNMLVAPLEELDAMVGMMDVKKIIFDQLIYYLQNLDDKNVDMLHTVIVGPPGVGKTQLTHIIAKIYNRLGFLKTDKVICAKRDDLIGEYIGQTAPKTRKVLERALGGVLLLDEIYSMAPTSERDFAREAIDMINMYLSEHAHDLVCVVAGYKKPTYEKFFSQNEGLARRFTHHFEIKGYSHDELALIFKKYLEGQKWMLGATLEEIAEIIKEHMELFPNFGGDMTTLFACCKKAHSRRLLSISTEAELNSTKKKIQKPDIIEAVGIYKEIKEKHSSSGEEDKSKYMHMYV